jgi:glycolate oxidase iron-sulfur subunit
MQTRFTDAQRQDPAIRASEEILRKCVHCGFCTATCPTYVLLGDELDSPRGRIYLIKEMLENDRPATPEVVRHVDRCLSCLACMTTCPSGVHYQHLVDHARAHIEQTYRRPFFDRTMRALLARVMPYPARFRLLLGLARLFRPFSAVLPRRLGASLALVPRSGRATRGPVSASVPAQAEAPVPSEVRAAADTPAPATTAAAKPAQRTRVGLVQGCVQAVLGEAANAATRRMLERLGCDVVLLDGCCGSLTHHLGRARETRAFVSSFVDTVAAASAGGPLDAIVVNASGCGTHLKDLGFVFREDEALARGAADIGELTADITEIIARLGLPSVVRPGGLRVAYHSACSMQHGQRLEAPPRDLLRAAGFELVEIPEAHLCCGSAGTYNMLQPELAGRLAARKLDHIRALDVDVIAAGNLGCMTQLATGAERPIVHTVELLDWATGGPKPAALAQRSP